MSNDIDAETIIRSAFVDEIVRRGWNVVPTEKSDRILRETLGISYGGQLASTTPEEVCRSLDVEGVFYGEVLEWNKTTTGIYNDVTVTASFDLYAKDGTRVWQGSDTQARVNVPRGRGDIGAEIIVYALGNLLLNPMTPYGKEVARSIAGRLPGGLLDRIGPDPAKGGAPPLAGGTEDKGGMK